jgi:hypothetical protein
MNPKNELESGLMRRTPRRTLPLNGLIDLRVVGGAIVVASLLIASTLGLLLATRSPKAAAGQVTAALTLIAANTPTPVSVAGQSTPAPGAETQMPTPPPGVIAVGAYVQIVGTGGDGLRLRDQAGLSAQVLMLGSEAEVFRVQEGPKEADGYTWWYLVGPFDSSRRGWAAVNFLQVVQQ